MNKLQPGTLFIDPEARLIQLHGNIEDNNISKLSFFLLSLLNEDDKLEEADKSYVRTPIKFYINSPGGYVTSMWGLLSIMDTSKTPIHTYCTSEASSSAFMIFLGGSKRFVYPNATLMYHQCSGGIRGTLTDIEQRLDNISKNQDAFENYVSNKTRIPMSKLKEVRERKIDWYMSPDDALTLGVATDIIR